jgi:hypothetical protein
MGVGHFVNAVTGSTIGGRSFQINSEVVGGIVTGSVLGQFRALPVAGKDADILAASLTGMYLSRSFGTNAASGSIIKALNFVMARADAGAEVTWTEVSSALGSANSDGIINDDFIPKVDSAYDLGNTKTKWRYAYLDAADIDGGNIDGTVIGAASVAAGSFAAVAATSGDFGNGNITNVGSLEVDSVIVADASIGLDIVFGGATEKNKISLTDNLAIALNITEGSNSYMNFSTADGSELITFAKGSTFAGTTIADLGIVTTVDINGGTADAVVIGGASPAAGNFTTVVAGTSVNTAALTATGLTSLGGGDLTVSAGGALAQAGASTFTGAATFGALGSSTLFIAGVDAAGDSKLYRLAVSGGILRAEQQ